MKNRTIYTSDYRSPPSGCGTVEKLNGQLILIQDEGCCPQVSPGIYSKIIKIPADFGINPHEAFKHLIDILKSLEVEVVYDYELVYDFIHFEDFKSELNEDDGYITINEFESLRKGL